MRADRRQGGRARDGRLHRPAAAVSSSRFLRGLLWLSVPSVGVVPTLVRQLLPNSPGVRPLMIGLFFASAVLRTASAARRPGARTLPLMMAAAFTLFGTGSLILALNPAIGFPSVAELFFGAAYLCITGFLVLDASGRAGWTMRAVLETGVAAGGIVSAAVFVLVTPVAAQQAVGGVALLIALLYPLSDVVLVTILLTQLATRRRLFDGRSGLLLAGLLTLGAVDASLPLGLSSAGYTFSAAEDVVWAAALAALADAAARPSRSTQGGQQGLAAPVAVAAGVCALAVLAIEPNTLSLTHWPAVLTMALSLGLLMTSLHDARSAGEARRLSRTDDLTGLGNRRAVGQRLAAAASSSCTLLLLDLNGFKAVNDAFGHPEGDRLLIGVGQRLRGAVPDGDLVARLGGDEFAVICAGADRMAGTRAAERIVSALQEPLAVGDLELTVSVAIGIAASSSKHHQTSDLLRRADVAMYRAKTAGGGYRWYDPQIDEYSVDRLHLTEQLRTAIPGGQLRAFFQPQVDPADGTLVAVEALVRWQHPTRGLLAPAEFLAPARAAGLMLPLSLAMMRLCVGQAASWANAGHPLRVSLNVDPPELLSGAWGSALIFEIDRACLDPALFTVELTEELLVNDPTRAAERVQELARHGIEVSIDDYGTGYSGLAWLQTLPVRELKLARPFVSKVLTDTRTRIILESTVQLASQLRLRVVAEGVEDPATADAMTRMGVDLLQGYLISQPLPAANLDTWRTSRPITTLPAAVPPGDPTPLHVVATRSGGMPNW